MTKIQFYSHYKLPITMDPLKYGKLLDQFNNKFIINLTTKNIAIINQEDKQNFIRIFKNGDLVLEYKDTFISDRSFSRFINDKKFIFENDRLISTQILNALRWITIFDSNNNNPLLYDSTYLNKFVEILKTYYSTLSLEIIYNYFKNKLTKAELISKLKNISDKKIITSDKKEESNKIVTSNKIDNWKYFSNLKFKLFKTYYWFIKITYIGILISLFTKFKIFSRIWKIFYTIIVAIWGLNFMDNIGFDYIKNLWGEFVIWNIVIIDIISDSNFYKFLTRLIVKKEEIIQSTEEVTKSTNKGNGEFKQEIGREKTTNNQGIGSSDRHSRISEWLKSGIEEKVEPEPESYTKYYILGAIVVGVVGCLAWTYSDEIRDTGFALWEWINSFRPEGRGNRGDPGNTGINPNTGTAYIPQVDSPDIELKDNKISKIQDQFKKEEWSSQPKSPESPSSISSDKSIKNIDTSSSSSSVII